ncbi:hypothetical protein [Litorisediminicola beolgyonensis]|uniref:Lipoprotein n=1 Tax=Litorisediminicola beolgyonensis TaxID=1173614 RepID=A0ABW3ZNA6_9RHOB
MRAAALLFAVLTTLAACADGQRELKEPVRAIGDFKLGHAIVVAPNIQQGPGSRDASAEEWIEVVDAALEERFRRYEGERLYHIGVSVEGFVLAVPGIPLVYTPKSVLIVRANLFDDAGQVRMTDEAHEITVLEAPSGKTFLGSGNSQTKEEQMRALAANAALQIENWLRGQQKREGWFGGLPEDGAEPVSEAPETEAEDDALPETPQVFATVIEADPSAGG